MTFDREISHYVIKKCVLAHKGHIINKSSIPDDNLNSSHYSNTKWKLLNEINEINERDEINENDNIVSD